MGEKNDEARERKDKAFLIYIWKISMRWGNGE